ncbi:hypothetical protein [Streptomyces sp. KL116D]|uniref:hypothetical protein n=1 Tax=Streptomyces sp. KL116D TaxID=3045152 RepID=UPI0035562304
MGFFGLMPVIAFAFSLPQMLETPKSAGFNYAFGLGALAVGLVQIPYGLFGMVSGPWARALARRVPMRTLHHGGQLRAPQR